MKIIKFFSATQILPEKNDKLPAGRPKIRCTVWADFRIFTKNLVSSRKLLKISHCATQKKTKLLNGLFLLKSLVELLFLLSQILPHHRTYSVFYVDLFYSTVWHNMSTWLVEIKVFTSLFLWKVAHLLKASSWIQTSLIWDWKSAIHKYKSGTRLNTHFGKLLLSCYYRGPLHVQQSVIWHGTKDLSPDTTLLSRSVVGEELGVEDRASES